MTTKARLPKPGRHRMSARQITTAARLIARMETIQDAAIRPEQLDQRMHALWLVVDNAGPEVTAAVMAALDLRITEAIEELAS